MKESLERETSAREKADERFITEMQKRVRAEEALMRLQEENKSLRADKETWLRAVADMCSCSNVSIRQDTTYTKLYGTDLRAKFGEGCSQGPQEPLAEVAVPTGSDLQGKEGPIPPPPPEIDSRNSTNSSEEVQRILADTPTSTLTEQMQHITGEN